MKKAVIATGGKQYLVTEGETIEIERIKDAKEKLNFTPLLVIDGDNVLVGTPEVEGAKVSAKVVEELKADKVTSIRYKAKKRVKKIRGHRQIKTRILVEKITSK